MNQITIHNTQLPIIEYQGQRVVTLAMIDQVHQRPEGTAGRNFREHRERFVEGRDYFEVTADEIRTQSLGHAFAPRTPKGLLLTERGYLLLTKPFQDNLAWEVQGRLVDEYFSRPKQSVPALPGDYEEALVALIGEVRQRKQLQLENQQQADRIDSLENLFMPGETPTQFCKRLNGVNTQQINATLLGWGWIFDAEHRDGKSPKYRVASRVRDHYLTEKPRKITAEGCDPFIKYDLQLLLDGAKRLHQLYMLGRLPMKKGWDGEFTQLKIVPEGKIGRVLGTIDRLSASARQQDNDGGHPHV